MHFDYLCELVQLVEYVPIRSSVCASFVCVHLRKLFGGLFVPKCVNVFLQHRKRLVFVPICADLCLRALRLPFCA